jgi:hypothetical protein
MTSKENLANQIDSLLYWAETMKELYAELKDSEGTPDYDEISWIAWLMKQRAESVRELLRGDEFKQ